MQTRSRAARRSTSRIGEDMDAWNHNSYCVSPEHVDRLCEAIEALFPWSLIVRKPHLVGYRLGDDLNRGALYLRPMAPARALLSALSRLRGSDAELSGALDAMEAQDPDLGDHQGVRIASVEEWEERVGRACMLATDRPELEVTVVRVERPGDPGALTDYLYQAWIRLGLLGPIRNTLEMQALFPGKLPIR